MPDSIISKAAGGENITVDVKEQKYGGLLTPGDMTPGFSTPAGM